MPLRQANLLELFPDADLTFDLGDDLDAYGFTINDKVTDIYHKYFLVQGIP